MKKNRKIKERHTKFPKPMLGDEGFEMFEGDGDLVKELSRSVEQDLKCCVRFLFTSSSINFLTFLKISSDSSASIP